MTAAYPYRPPLTLAERLEQWDPHGASALLADDCALALLAELERWKQEVIRTIQTPLLREEAEIAAPEVIEDIVSLQDCTHTALKNGWQLDALYSDDHARLEGYRSELKGLRK